MLGSSYNLFGTINAPTKSVNALAFSTNERYLASGSNDMTVCVYNVKHQFSIVQTYKGRGPFTVTAWLEESLIAGTSNGEVSLFHPVTEKILVAELYSPIASLEVSKSGSSLLVCPGLCATSMFTQKSQWQLKCHLDQPRTFEEIEEFGAPDGFAKPPLVATSAHFLQSEKECIVTYLHHSIWKCQLEAGTNTLLWGLDEKVGFAALSPDLTGIAATNIRSGIHWLKIVGEKCKKMSSSLEVAPNHKANIPVPVLFIEKGKAILMGSTKGQAVILNAKSGGRVTVLDHGSEGPGFNPQSGHFAYVFPTGGSQMLATGDRNCELNTRIKVWIEDSDDLDEVGSQMASLSNPVPILVSLAHNILTVVGLLFVIIYCLPGHWQEVIKDSVTAVLSPLPYTASSGKQVETASESGSRSVLEAFGDIGKPFFQGLRLADIAPIGIDSHITGADASLSEMPQDFDGIDEAGEEDIESWADKNNKKKDR
ncbi:WD40-repeat-containing domain protein [Rhodocollybia butyracea]|uniref:WD40-repeat-containing domain protein n=1 Tax=Rhodocollybia butyracea TaxID=206335 RepID=A0A9P5U760_9AGAR|nr:WD40-repeat-containing domain protein [Rhodocollybia butyracea]